MYGMPQYIYHDGQHKKYFGRYNSTENDILYALSDGVNNLGIIHRKNKHITKHSGSNLGSNANFSSPAGIVSGVNDVPAVIPAGLSATGQVIAFDIE